MGDRRFRSYFAHDNDGSMQEYDCTMCGHGGEVIVQKPGSQDWDFCMKCMKPICLHCARVMQKLKGECVVFERQIRAREVQLQMRRRAGFMDEDRPAKIITGLRDRVIEISEESLAAMRDTAVIIDTRGNEARAAVIRDRELLEAHLDVSM